MADALQALQARIRACRLCAHAAHPVVAGSAGARIMVVGQAPGKTEESLGQPWMGPAGKRLMRWMVEVVGFESPEAFRAQVYFSAVTRCYPGRHPKGHGDRKPSPPEIAACAPHLNDELALVKPAVIVLVGTLAIERFLGKMRLEEAVGQAIPMAFDDFEAVLIPLPHPSGASTWLNDSEHQAQLERGLLRLRQLIGEARLSAPAAPPETREPASPRSRPRSARSPVAPSP